VDRSFKNLMVVGVEAFLLQQKAVYAQEFLNPSKTNLIHVFELQQQPHYSVHICKNL
jgi:hypothetical protein